MIYPILSLLSGFALGLAQICWHRKALLILGAGAHTHATVSVVVIVGLGIGGLALNRSLEREQRAVWFLRGAELLTAAIGLLALLALGTVFDGVARWAPLPRTLFVVGVLGIVSVLAGVCVPLAMHLAQSRTRWQPGSTLLLIYGLHTLGTGIAFLIFPLIVLKLGIVGTLQLSLLGNLLCVALTFVRTQSPSQAPQRLADPSVATGLSLRRAVGVSFLLGLANMATQCLWFHYLTFTNAGAGVLYYYFFGVYILGLGLGALISHRAQVLGPTKVMLAALASAAAVSLLFVPLLSWLVLAPTLWPRFIFVFLVSALIGTSFPVLLFWVKSQRLFSNADNSKVYATNFLGSGLGALLVGHLAMNELPSSLITAVICCLYLLLFVVTLKTEEPKHRKKMATSYLFMFSLLAVAGWCLSRGAFERMQWKTRATSLRLEKVVESRYGLVTLDNLGRVYSNGAFSGSFGIRPENFTNRIFRCHAILSLLKKPSDVVMVGLGSGTWAATIAGHPLVKSLTVLELDPAFERIYVADPVNAQLLRRKHVKLIYADAREWLSHHPRSFDLIITNTAFHWQLNISHLLSLEFLRIAQGVLRPAGLYAFNSTGSPEAIASALATFTHVARVANFIVVSDHAPIVFEQERLRSAFGGHTLVPPLARIVELAGRDSELINGFEGEASLRRRYGTAPAISDDRPYSEFKDVARIIAETAEVSGI